MSDLGVDRVCEVDGRRTRRQRYDVTTRGEDVDLARVDLEAQRVKELARVLGLLLPVDELANPRHVRAARLGSGSAGERPVGVDPAVAVLLVLPVRRDAVLRPAVHRGGADLQL